MRIDLLDEYGGDGGRLAELFGAEARRRLGAVASGRMSDVGARYELPALPPLEIVMFARAQSLAADAAARALEAAVQSMLRAP
ncbi:hypothetical protein BK022_13805 [Methylorubrum extorquens]|uniref:Uncharacterized protein n=1 Tax=Methylorubrum extorquens TaxID=408 RepID=A0A1S1NZQ0_METEX|nr:hypothetical protein BK022_13805 [Methylorubrum extorquens]